MTMSSNTASADSDSEPDPAWVEAESLIRERIGSLTMWDAEKWAASYERQLSQISLMENRVSFLHAAGGSEESDYLLDAFARIDGEIDALDWTPTKDQDASSDRAMALSETVAAVGAVARHALTAVVLADDRPLARL